MLDYRKVVTKLLDKADNNIVVEDGKVVCYFSPQDEELKITSEEIINLVENEGLTYTKAYEKANQSKTGYAYNPSILMDFIDLSEMTDIDILILKVLIEPEEYVDSNIDSLLRSFPYQTSEMALGMREMLKNREVEEPQIEFRVQGIPIEGVWYNKVDFEEVTLEKEPLIAIAELLNKDKKLDTSIKILNSLAKQYSGDLDFVRKEVDDYLDTLKDDEFIHNAVDLIANANLKEGVFDVVRNINATITFTTDIVDEFEILTCVRDDKYIQLTLEGEVEIVVWLGEEENYFKTVVEKITFDNTDCYITPIVEEEANIQNLKVTIEK